MLLKCLKNSQILRLIESANNLPPHWLLVPTQGKQPLGFEWQKYPYNPITLATTLAFGSIQVKNREQKLYNVVPTGFGVICGRNEREYLVAIDCDGASVHSKIPPLPKTIAFTSGLPGRAQYLFKIAGNCDRLKSRKITFAPSEQLEIRGTGHASVLPPSVHPVTKKYNWLPGCSPREIEVAVAPNWIIEQMSPPLPPPAQHRKNITYQSRSSNNDETRALKILQKIPTHYADDYHLWIRVGMALKNVSPNLLCAWDTWSQQSSKYKPGECEFKWKSFTKSGQTIGTLYYLANN